PAGVVGEGMTSSLFSQFFLVGWGAAGAERCVGRYGGAFRAERKPPPIAGASRPGSTLGRSGVLLLFAGLEAEAVPVQFQDVNMVGEPIQQSASQTLRAQHLGPLGKGQVAGHQRGSPFVALTEDFEQ